MSYEEFRHLVGLMRDAQRSYFQTRDAQWLEQSKRLEREVDRALARPLDDPQRSLFGGA